MTEKNIKIISFWKGFDYQNNCITGLLNKYSIKYKYNSNEPEILFIGSFVKDNEIDYIRNFDGIKILYITEPIDVCYINTYELFKNNIFDIVFGCISNDIEKNYFKYPLYIMYSYDYYLNKKYADINEKILNENLEQKKFCTLINTHDRFKTRSEIYNLLKNINDIDCPSILFNNMSNQELNSIGNIKFINKYLFNLCPENTKCEFNGYITEKLMNCCLSGSIPIYYGSFDKIDEKIFNKDRIIFFDPYEQESIDKASKYVEELFNNKEKLNDFYKQKVFNDEAYDTINNMEMNLMDNLKLFFN